MNTVLPIVTGFIAIFGSVLLWSLNQRNKARQEIYIRKEEKYAKLILSLKGFYSQSQDKSMTGDFLVQLNLCWMYCPDDVILKAYNFIDMVKTDRKRQYSAEERAKAVGEFILAIRKDLMNNKKFSKTKLTAENFQILGGTSTT